MPELPEVENNRRYLAPNVLHKKITEIEVLKPKIVKQNSQFGQQLKGLHFTSLKRRAKLLIFETNDSNTFVLGHLGMTGVFLFNEANFESRQESDIYEDPNSIYRHARLIYHFVDGSQLLFRDMRMFGYNIIATEEEKNQATAKYGIEPGLANYTWENFQTIFNNRKTSIKSLLLNQNVIAGLGNIYADEVLFLSKVHPKRLVHSINETEKKALFKNVSEVLMEAIQRGGEISYSPSEEEEEASHLYVYGRTGQACKVCQSVIEKTKVAGRGTHFCCLCQKAH